MQFPISLPLYNYFAILYRVQDNVTYLSKFLNGSLDPGHAPIGFSLSSIVLVLATVNVRTKFEVSSFVHSEYRKSGLRIYQNVDLRLLGSSSIDRSHMNSY